MPVVGDPTGWRVYPVEAPTVCGKIVDKSDDAVDESSAVSRDLSFLQLLLLLLWCLKLMAEERRDKAEESSVRLSVNRACVS